MIRGLFSGQQPIPPRPESASAQVPDVATKTAHEAAGGVVHTDQLVQRVAGSNLDNRNVFGRIESRDLLDILRDGAVPPDRAAFYLDSVEELRMRRFVLQLSDDGKKALLDQTPEVMEELATGKTHEIAAKAPLKLDAIQEIMVPPEQKEALLKSYGEMVAKGEAPEAIAGKPFQTFFDQHVRATDDMLVEVELKNFRKQVPGFTAMSSFEQKARASLGGRMAESLPSSLPGDVRRQMASSLIRHKSFNRRLPDGGLGVTGEIKEFFHGTTMGNLVSKVGFRGQPEMLFNQLPEGMQKLMKDKFNVRFASAMGPGVYYGNASVASLYATLKLSGKPVQIVSGLVAMGKTTTKEFLGEDTRISSVASPEGAYYVTKDAKRFSIKGLTTLDTKKTDGWMRFFPQILKAHEQDPTSIGYVVDRLPAGPSQRALEEALKAGDPVTRKSATLLLARRGHEASLASTLKMLEGASEGERKVIEDTLTNAVLKIGPGKAERTAPLMETLMKLTEGRETERGELLLKVFQSLGDESMPLIQRYGVQVEATAARKGLMDQALDLASKGIKRLF